MSSRSAASLAFVIALAGAVESQAGSSGILYGKDHVYEVTAPPGWVLDNRAGAEEGLHAVFYPERGSWRESRAVMYTSTDRLDPGQSLAAFIEHELDEFSAGAGGMVRVKVGAPVTTASGARAEVRHLSGDRWGNRESIAYFDAAPIVAMVVLTSRDDSEFASSAAAFDRLVSSYRFLGRSLAELSSIPRLVEIADANARTSEGARYDAEVGKRFAERHATLLGLCAPSGAPTTPPLDILLLVAETRVVRRALVDPESEVGRCLQPLLLGADFPPPPTDDYWARIELTITE
jgi:hypothetical protein